MFDHLSKAVYQKLFICETCHKELTGRKCPECDKEFEENDEIICTYDPCEDYDEHFHSSCYGKIWSN